MWSSVERDIAELRSATEQMRLDGIAYAKSEAAYQSAKARRALEMRTDGIPATIISTVIKGDETVNQFLMERECAKAIYESDREQINTLKIAIRIGENQIQREWQG